MSGDGKPTAATFRDPLLKVLGEMTKLSVSTEVNADEALDAVYEETGIGEDDHGTVDADRPYVRVVAVRAFNRMLKRDGLAESPRRGIWRLTDKGVRAASLMTGPFDTEELEDDVIELPHKGEPAEVPADTRTPPAANHGGGLGVSWSLGEQANSYSPDPYIMGLAIKSTGCYGKLSQRSDLCRTCPISGACKTTVLGTVSTIAADLRRQDEERLRRAMEPERPEEHEGEADVASPDDKDIAEILDIINEGADGEDGGKPGHSVIKVPVSGICEFCKEEVPRGSQGVWARGDGMYHIQCFDEKYGAKDPD